jgi:tripartite-type tricarboxylate transporter receptor subunit TctC
MKGKVFISFIIVLTAMVGNTYSADYPSKPITLQVPSPAGGGTDVGARFLAFYAEKKMGQPIVVINRPGANQQVGWTELASQKPDGYYIGFATCPSMNTIILDPDRKAVFNLDSFVPIINQVVDPGVVWVKAESPYKTLKDFLDDAKRRPGAIRTGATGTFSDDHLAILKLEEVAGIKVRTVQFNGFADALTATLGGHVDISFNNVGEVVPRLKSGEVRVLAVMDPQRSKFMPDVPTMADLGYPTVISSSSRGVVGPRGIPDPIVKKIQEVYLDAMKNPEYIEKLDKAGLASKPIIGEEYGKYLQAIHAMAKPLVEKGLKERKPGR